MKLRDVLYGVNLVAVNGDTNAEVTGLTADSRNVNQGTLFIAVKGTAVDGHKFIDGAIQDGARSIVCEKLPDNLIDGINYIVVNNSQKALGFIANNFYYEPSKKLKLIGVTGTNGKTTTCTLLFELFREMGHNVGLISTVVNKINEQEIPTKHTTPDPIVLCELLAKMVDNGCEYCFMEVSSHAVVQNRIAGLTFAAAGFTNITHEHLDYHKTFKAYIDAKKTFFDGLNEDAFAVTNIDDKNGMVMLQNSAAKKVTYGLKMMADYKAKIIENQISGLVLMVDGTEVYTRLIGDFNAYNILLVYAIAVELTNNPIEVMRIISKLKPVEGRFEYHKSETGVIAIVDYAHTPDALLNVLKTIKNIRTGNETVYTVVGCGGDRDRTKRPEMAKISCELSDKVLLTSDNPRTENPEAIIDEMMKGVEGVHFHKTLCITNRAEAIKAAASSANKGDIILIAGKGHETYQEINGVRHDFDDLEIVKETLKKLNK